MHAVEAVLRGTECSLLLTFGPAGEQFQRRVRSLSGKVDGLLIAEEVMPSAQLRALARRIPVVSSRAARMSAASTWSRWTTRPACGPWPPT